MKSREANLRLKRFEADEKARKVADLQHMVREFESMAADLDRQIQSEEDRTGIKDASHFAYSTFAKAATQRRANLKASVDDLIAKLEVAVKERDAAAADLQAASTTDNRDTERTRRIDRSPGIPLR